VAIAMAASVWTSSASAQSTGAAGGAGGGPAPASAAGGAGPATGGGATAPAVQFFPGGVAPTPPGQALGGGNVSGSSSRPKTGGETDGFDLGRPASGGASSVYGTSGGPIFQGGSASHVIGDTASSTHVVKKGDTLWGICDHYFENPYQWPRIWSYNPQIQNPHWIEVGDQIKLKGARTASDVGSDTPELGRGAMAAVTGRLIDTRRKVPPRTVFLREEGFVEDEELDVWGELTGSPLEKSFLSDTDETYVRIAPGKEVQVGQELTVFRPVRKAGDKGRIVAIQGTVRINQYNAKERLARATVIETLDVIERGARLGSIPRRFEVVPPVRNTTDLEAHVLASVRSHAFQSQHNIIYIDKGSEDGLVPGNTLRFVRKGDAWRKSLPPGAPAKRIDSDADDAAHVETVPAPRNERAYPDEVIGELRILTTKPHTSMALVTGSKKEIEYNDVAISRKGF